MKKSWRMRLAEDSAQPQIKPIPVRMRKKSGPGTIVIPSFREVERTIRKIPKGRLATVQHLSENLAQRFHTTIACNVTTGIFAWMTANAAHEAERDGEKRVAPYWRVLKSDGVLNLKFPGGLAGLRARLESEGHSVVKDRERYRVESYEKKLAKL